MSRRIYRASLSVLMIAGFLQFGAAYAADIPCKADTNKRVGPQGNVTACLLADNFKIGSHTCSKGKMAGFYPDGKLKDCHLTEPVVINGISCKDSFALTADGKLRRCKTTAPVSIGGVKEIPAGAWISVYKSGALKRLEVETPVEMKGQYCKGYMNYFHENGQIKKCGLAEAKTVGKTAYKAGDFLCWDDQGKQIADCKMLSWNMMD